MVIKLDLGCGPNPKEGFIGVDSIKFNDNIVQLQIGSDVWPWEDNSVEEAHCSHTIEHLTNFNDKWERVHFFNELYRVLQPGGKCTLIFPHWSSNRYYGDPTHKEVISEMAFYYLSKEWRKTQAPHTDIEWNPNGYKCDYEAVWGYGTHPTLATRNAEYQQWASQFLLEARQDLHVTLTKKV
jgi:hypothetical protein